MFGWPCYDIMGSSIQYKLLQMVRGLDIQGVPRYIIAIFAKGNVELVRGRVSGRVCECVRLCLCVSVFVWLCLAVRWLVFSVT